LSEKLRLYGYSSLTIQVYFFTNSQLKLFSEDIYEQIQKWGVQDSDENLKKNTTNNQPLEHIPGNYPKNT
jgi:hypothetical protein